MRRAVRLLVVLIVASVCPLAADELHLKNGDRYTGTVVSLQNGTLRFETPHGELAIPWTEVSALSVNQPLEVRTADGQVTARAGGPLDVSATAALTRPAPPLTWEGGANAGLLASGGNTDVHSLRIDGEVVARDGDNRYTVAALLNRVEDGGRETARNASLSAGFDRFITRRLFLNGNAIFTNDRFRDLDLRTALGAGLGYQVLDTSRATLRINSGLGYVHEHFRSTPDNRYAALQETSKAELFVVGDRVVLFHSHDAYFGITGDDNLFVRTQNGVRLGLIARLVTTAQLDLDYDRSPAPGRGHTDRTFALTFGYRF